MLHKIKTLFSKGLGFAYVFLKYHLRNKNKKVDSKSILIIFGGHLGNAILNVDTLLEIKKAYSAENGWTISIVCNNGIRKILEKVADMSGFQFLDYSFPYEDGGTRFNDVWKMMRFMKGKKYDKIVVNLAHVMPLATYIVACTPANDSIGVFDDVEHSSNENHDIEHNFGNARWYFEKAYKSPIKVEFNTQEVVRQKLILKHLGIDYKIRVYPIPQLCSFDLPKQPYFTVTIDSANPLKRWEPESFAQVINYIQKFHSEYTACITGGGDAAPLYDRLLKAVEYKDRVVSYIGKTSFDQWVELLRGSSFHFGVDSGSIHVASSAGTQAFSLIGVWDGTRVLPYQVEREEEHTCSPICIYMDGVMDLKCYGCIPKRGLMGSGNDQCAKRCSNKEICCCLSSISPEQAFETIKTWLMLQKGEDRQ
jgi:ADP-heptose:LPS heptosyltransferase